MPPGTNAIIGELVSHYRVVEKIGQGGMGEVFLAEDTSLHRKVALKFLPPARSRCPPSEIGRDRSACQNRQERMSTSWTFAGRIDRWKAGLRTGKMSPS